jgi:hypothetical protein
MFLKISLLLILAHVSMAVIAASTTSGFTTTWYCPSEERGELPREKTVSVSINEAGELSLKPNVFNVDKLDARVLRLFKKKKSHSALPSCLESFYVAAQASYKEFQKQQCTNDDSELCRRTEATIRQNLETHVQQSSYQKKYGNMSSLPTDTPKPSEPTGVRRLFTQIKGKVSSAVKGLKNKLPKPTSGVSGTTPATPAKGARAELLDLMTDNAGLLSDEETKQFESLCPQLGETPGANRVWCAQEYRQRSKLLGRMSQLLSSITQTSVSEIKALSGVACLQKRDDFSDIENLLGAISKKDDCDELEPGQYKKNDFLLRRKPDGNYEAILTAKFVYKSGSLTEKAMKDKINTCLSTIVPYLRGPGGETLHIRLFDEAQAEKELSVYQRPNVETLNLESAKQINSEGQVEGVRGNSANLNDAMGCSTLTHEFLHHLGLGDEYPENSDVTFADGRSMKESWSCRVLPTQNTIMRFNIAAMAAVVPTKLTCKCKGETCRKALSKFGALEPHILQLLSTQDSNDFIRTDGMTCKPVTTPSTSPFLEQGRRTILLSQGKGNIVFEGRHLSLPMVQGYEEKFQITRVIHTCTCNGDATCEATIPQKIAKLTENQPAITCPWDFESVKESQFNPENPIATKEKSQISNDQLILITKPTSKASLLAPNHFRRILYGNCPTGPVALYNKCHAQSYISAKDPKCDPNRAVVCNERDYLGFGTP